MKSEFDKTLTSVRRIINECPWGKEETLERHIEELAIEVNELRKAIENNDKINIKEELGDVFYDSMFLLLLAERDDNVNFEEILKNVREKIEKRTPWVFGNMKGVKTREEAENIWNQIKQKEKVGKI